MLKKRKRFFVDWYMYKTIVIGDFVFLTILNLIFVFNYDLYLLNFDLLIFTSLCLSSILISVFWFFLKKKYLLGLFTKKRWDFEFSYPNGKLTKLGKLHHGYFFLQLFVNMNFLLFVFLYLDMAYYLLSIACIFGYFFMVYLDEKKYQ